MIRRIRNCAFMALAAYSAAACDLIDRGDGHDTVVATTQNAAFAKSTIEPGVLRMVDAAPVIRDAASDSNSDAAAVADDSPLATAEPFEVAIRTTDPTSGHARTFGTITMKTALRTRTTDLGNYPCTSCHLGRRIVMRDERIADAHRNIRPEHPDRTGRTCATCHSADNVEMLALKSGERATLDHAYRLCAQCHFSQAESWAGGAHGKRLDGWQGRRVVMGCADCHDPHRPAVEKRVPFRAPQIHRIRSNDR